MVAVVWVSGCDLGNENEFDYKFELVVENQSDEIIYIIGGKVSDDEGLTDGAWLGVLPGSVDRVGLGGRAAENEPPGGCFDNRVWVVRSRSGTEYLEGAQHDDVDDTDLEILKFFPDDTCVDTVEITYSWAGSTSS